MVLGTDFLFGSLDPRASYIIAYCFWDCPTIAYMT